MEKKLISEELADAINTISKHCESTPDCSYEECPFFCEDKYNANCMFSKTPLVWKDYISSKATKVLYYVKEEDDE